MKRAMRTGCALLFLVIFLAFGLDAQSAAAQSTWCYQWDFTVNDGGFTPQPGSSTFGNYGVWSAAGWGTSDHQYTTTFGDYIRGVHIKKTFGGSATLTQAEVTFNRTAGTFAMSTAWWAMFGDSGTLSSESAAGGSSGTPLIKTWSGSASTTSFAFLTRTSYQFSASYSGSATIKSVKLQGTGTFPLGDNCSPTPTPTATYTPSNTNTPTPTPTETYTPSNTPTNTYTPTATFTPSDTPTNTYTPTPTYTLTPSYTPTPTLSPTSDYITPGPTITPSNTLSPTPTRTPTLTPTGTITPSLTPSLTPTLTLTPSNTSAPTWTPSPTWTPRPPTATPIDWPTLTPDGQLHFKPLMTWTPSEGLFGLEGGEDPPAPEVHCDEPEPTGSSFGSQLSVGMANTIRPVFCPTNLLAYSSVISENAVLFYGLMTNNNTPVQTVLIMAEIFLIIMGVIGLIRRIQGLAASAQVKIQQIRRGRSD